MLVTRVRLPACAFLQVGQPRLPHTAQCSTMLYSTFWPRRPDTKIAGNAIVILSCYSNPLKLYKQIAFPFAFRVRVGQGGQNSATGTRTRVARVRAEYPNQLDYSGSVTGPK
jgi:hypothetical protein